MARTPRLLVLATAALVLAGGIPLVSRAQPQGRAGMAQQGALSASQQRDEMRRALALLRAAERLAEDGRQEDAEARFEEAKSKVDAVGAAVDDRLTRMFERTSEQVAESHAKLTEAGVPLESLNVAQADAPATRGGPNPAPARGGVSFARQVAPLLAGKCGACHVDDQRGGVSLASYRDMVSRAGERRLITPRAPAQSLIVQVIQSGAMPRGGGTVQPQELQLIERWISEGAAFDGDDPSASLRLVSAAAPASRGRAMPADTMNEPELARPSGDETVSFALDVAPVLTARCAACHVQDDSGGLQFATFRGLLEGGDGGPVVQSGAPDRSALVRRLTGDDQPRMPPRGPAVPDEEIEKIATWVREGATFDGGDAADPLERATALTRARRATPEELNGIRLEAASANWRLALPDEAMNSFASDRVLVVGATTEEELGAVAQAAEAAAGAALGELGVAESTPLGKARVTLYVFDERIDYSEFATMVEQRRLPDDLTAHWRYDVVDSYACLLRASPTDSPDAFALAHQLVAAYLAERAGGGAPHWLVDGAARVAAGHTNPRDPRVRAWLDRAKQLAAQMDQSNDFMTGKLGPDAAGVVGFSFAAPLMREEERFLQVIDALAAGKSVDEAFQATYGRPTGQLAELWRASLARGR